MGKFAQFTNRFHKNARLTTSFWISTLIIVALITLAFILNTTRQLKNQSEKGIKRELQAVLYTTLGALKIWSEELEDNHQAISQLPTVLTYLQNPHGTDAEELVRKALSSWVISNDFLSYAIFVRTPKGEIAPLLIQKNEFNYLFNSSNKTIEESMSGKFIRSTPFIEGEGVYAYTAIPVRDEANQILAVLAFVIDLREKFNDIAGLGRMGESGETYAINKKGQMLTQSRFGGYTGAHPYILQNQHPAIKHLSKGLMHGHDLDGYTDYRGVPVVGAWTWDKDLDLGLITEINLEEAYRPLNIIQRLVWIMIFILIFGMILLFALRETWSRYQLKIMQGRDEARRDLLATVSHDLKNPLNYLLMSNELLMKHLSPDDSALTKLRSLAEKNINAIKMMNQLIIDLLDASRIEEGKLEIYPVPLDGKIALKEAVELITPTATTKELTLKTVVQPDLPFIMADHKRLNQIFSNLLGNAVKFTPAGGTIQVEARVHDHVVEFSVSDNGPGIKKEDQTHLFERFWQADKSKGQGTGLGLAICKELVTAHGGEIWLDTHVPTGASFHFTIPIQESL